MTSVTKVKILHLQLLILEWNIIIDFTLSILNKNNYINHQFTDLSNRWILTFRKWNSSAAKDSRNIHRQNMKKREWTVENPARTDWPKEYNYVVLKTNTNFSPDTSLQVKPKNALKLLYCIITYCNLL